MTHNEVGWSDMDVHRAGRLAWMRSRSLRRLGALVCAPVLLGVALAACSSASAANAPVTLNYWSFPDNSGAIQQAVNNCSAASGGKYTISYNKLPTDADSQRQQLVRRLAAHDSSMDILALDVTWEAETAQAGWILPWTGANKAAAVQDMQQGCLAPVGSGALPGSAPPPP